MTAGNSEPVACPACYSINYTDSKFCGVCGGPLSMVCPSCGSAQPISKFCGSCGRAMTAAASAAPAPAPTVAVPVVAAPTGAPAPEAAGPVAPSPQAVAAPAPQAIAMERPAPPAKRSPLAPLLALLVVAAAIGAGVYFTQIKGDDKGGAGGQPSGGSSSKSLRNAPQAKEIAGFDLGLGASAAFFLPGGKELFIVAIDGSSRLVDVATGKNVRNYPALGVAGTSDQAAISADGKTALVSSLKGMVIRDIGGGADRKVDLGTNNTALAVSADGRLGLVGQAGGAVVFDLRTGKEAGRLPTQTSSAGYVWAVDIAPDAKSALTVNIGEKEVQLWDIASFKLIKKITLDGGPHHVQFAPGGNVAYVSSPGGDVWTIDLTSAKVTGHFDVHPRFEMEYTAVSQDGKYVLTGESGTDENELSSLFSMADGKPTRVLRGHKKNVDFVALSPDGTKAVTASSDGTVRVWDLS